MWTKRGKACLILIFSANTNCENMAYRSFRSEKCSARGVRKVTTGMTTALWQPDSPAAPYPPRPVCLTVRTGLWQPLVTFIATSHLKGVALFSPLISVSLSLRRRSHRAPVGAAWCCNRMVPRRRAVNADALRNYNRS